MQISIKYKIIACIIVSIPLIGNNTPIHEAKITTLTRKMCNAVFYCIASSDVSDETKTYVNDLMVKINPAKKVIAVRKFNTLGEYLFGNHNSIAVPFLNYLVINSKTLKQLPEDAQRFSIGRNLVQMNQGVHYLTYKYILPFLCDIYFEASEDDDQRDILARLTPSGLITSAQHLATGRTHWDQTQLAVKNDLNVVWKNIALRAGAALLVAYTSRILEHEADINTARTLNCASGGIKLLKHYASYGPSSSDGSFLGFTSSRVPAFEAINASAVHIAKESFPRLKNIDLSKKAYGITYARIPGTTFLSSLKDAMPGKIFPYSNWLQNGFWSLPLVKYFSHYQTIDERMQALKELENGQSLAKKVN